MAEGSQGGVIGLVGSASSWHCTQMGIASSGHSVPDLQAEVPHRWSREGF